MWKSWQGVRDDSRTWFVQRANEAGWREALDKLAALVEAGENTREGAS